ncbi:cutinase family protein [soil metagenome]
MRSRWTTGAGIIGAVAVVMSAVQIMPIPSAHAADCADAEVVFARGTTEDPGPGPNGQAFVDALRSRVSPKSVATYAVDYPATTDFATAVIGISDARAHILATAASCPQTKMVLGGFSQGAAVMGFVTADVVPEGVSPLDVPAPMPPDIADQIAAVALFGKPSSRFMRAISDPQITIGSLYTAKTIDLCVDNDLVCDPHGSSFAVHTRYDESGMIEQGASFAANQLQSAWAADAAASAAAAAAPPTDAPAAHLPASGTAGPVGPTGPTAAPSEHLPSGPPPPLGPETSVTTTPPV